MSVVIDANLIAAVVLPLPYSDQATERITTWKRAGVELLAPVLLEYEVAAILRKAVVAGWLTTDLAIEAMRMILALNIQCLPPTASLHGQTLHWAERLGHSNTYDAHYLALAESQDCPFWTGDERLFNAVRAGYENIFWMGN